MAYLFGASNSDGIACGTSPAHNGSYSLFVRFTPTGTGSGMLVKFGTDPVSVDGQIWLSAGSVSANFDNGYGHALATITWAASLGAGTTHAVVLTVNGAGTAALYGDGSATPRASGAPSGALLPVTGTVFRIGNNEGAAFSADATIQEVGWFPGTVLTGVQAATLTAGGQMTADFPVPANYWGFVSDATDLFGSADGTVTGASLVAGSGTNAFPAASGSTLETFAHADTSPGTLLGDQTWDVYAGTRWHTAGNAAVCDGTGTYAMNLARCETVTTSTDDVEVQATVLGLATGSYECHLGITCRTSKSPDSHYRVQANKWLGDAVPQSWVVVKRVAGVETQIGGDINRALSNGDVVRFRVNSSAPAVLTVWVNNTQVFQATDTEATLATGKQGGVYFQGYGAGDVATLDNWNLVDATPLPPPNVLVPTLWLSPDFGSVDYRTLFTLPAQWATIRQKVSVVQFAEWNLWSGQPDFQSPGSERNIIGNFAAVDAFRKLANWGIGVGAGLIPLDDPASFPSGPSGIALTMALDCCAGVAAAGGRVTHIEFDTALGRGTSNMGLTLPQIATKLKDFCDGILAVYPGILFGDADCITSFTAAQILDFLDACTDAEVPFSWFSLDPVTGGAFWTEVGDLATGLTTRGLPFKLIVNPAIASQSAATDASFCSQALNFAQSAASQLTTVAIVDVNSWYFRGSQQGTRDVPMNLPETTQDTLTHLAGDVATLFNVAQLAAPAPPTLTVLRQLQEARA